MQLGNNTGAKEDLARYLDQTPAANDRKSIEEAIAQIRVLHAGSDQHVEEVGVKGPLAKAFRIGEAEKAVPRPRARLKFRIEQLTLIVATDRDAGWSLNAKQDRSFGPCGAVSASRMPVRLIHGKRTETVRSFVTP